MFKCKSITSFFISYPKGLVSDKFFLVFAINPSKEVIALPKNDDVGMTLLIRPIFDNDPNHQIEITKDFSTDVGFDVMDAHFDQNGNLCLDYVAGPNYDEVKETIPINYAKFSNAYS